MNYQYKKYIPSGNLTALVIGIPKSKNERIIINNKIIKKEQVEQVGFISPDINNPQLIMAGGEFCGNATRSAINYYLNNKPGNIRIKVSSVPQKILGGIDKKCQTWVEMPVYKRNYIKIINNSIAIVRLYGITHLIISSSKISKEKAYNLLKKYNLLNEKSAGVIFYQKLNKNYYKITPIVFVKSVNTFFCETACGSGSAALGIYINYKNNSISKISIIQPSNMIIDVFSTIKKDKIEKVIISGQVF